ncbi:unnamed protein product, partial [Iphiclides podalirius]
MLGILRRFHDKCVSLESAGDSPRCGAALWRPACREGAVAALRQLREKDRAPTLLFTRDVAAPSSLR